MPPKRKRETKVVEENEVKSRPKRSTRKETPPPTPSDSESEEEVKKKPVKKAKAKSAKATKGRKKKVQNDDSEEEVIKPSRSRGRGQAPQKVEEAEKPEEDEEVEEKEDEEEDEEEEDKPPKGKKPKVEKAEKVAKNKTETNYEEIDFETCSRKNSKGEEYNLKISNWNVDGIRAWLKKGGLSYIEYEKPDIFCLQETKCSLDKLPSEVKEVEGYKAFWQCSSKDGYAGVALYSKIEPISVEYGLDDEDHDEEGRIITAEFEKFYVISVYVPNAGRGLVTLPKRLKWNEIFRNYVAELDKKKPVIVCGDMNVAHLEIDLSNPKTNTKNAGFTKEERDGMTDFLSDGYIDTFRELYPEKTNVYTFWTYMSNSRAKNVGWRLDYFIVSKRFMESICDNIIRSDVFGSDHCPITLFLHV